MAAKKPPTEIRVSFLTHGRDGRPAIAAHPLPRVGQRVVFSYDDERWTGTVTRHGVVRRVDMAIFDGGLKREGK